jgi:hypothetical protein
VKPRIYNVRERGVRVRLHIGQHSAMAEAMAGRFMRPVRVSAPHAGLLGPGTKSPHQTALAKCLVREAADKALGFVRRGAFELLLDELHMQRAGRPLRKALVWRKPLARRMPKIGASQRVIFFCEH